VNVPLHDPESTLIAGTSRGAISRRREVPRARPNCESNTGRFTERYIDPARGTPRHGFTMLAIGCLMLEALESFKRGWKKSVHQSEKRLWNSWTVSRSLSPSKGSAPNSTFMFAVAFSIRRKRLVAGVLFDQGRCSMEKRSTRRGSLRRWKKY